MVKRNPHPDRGDGGDGDEVNQAGGGWRVMGPDGNGGHGDGGGKSREGDDGEEDDRDEGAEIEVMEMDE